ncbi:hypothetical protein D3C86_1839900 [compost metagenome]
MHSRKMPATVCCRQDGHQVLLVKVMVFCPTEPLSAVHWVPTALAATGPLLVVPFTCVVTTFGAALNLVARVTQASCGTAA